MTAVEIDAMPIGRSMSRRVFFATAALVFVTSAAATIVWCRSMAAMPGMAMPGGWTMSMAWMRMPGQGWAGMAASFLGMWAAMMVAMMLPALLPVLWRFRETLLTAGKARPGWLTLQAGLGYFLAWIMLGAAIFPAGVVLASLAMDRPDLSRSVPLTAGLVVLAAGALQFTAWKQRLLACCRSAPDSRCLLRQDAGAAWACGIRLGYRCISCCAGSMAILLVIGVMDPGAMIVVAAAITAERVLPGGERVAQIIGIGAMTAGLFMIARTAGLV
jgi:predicted metal-binding membrane protein